MGRGPIVAVEASVRAKGARLLVGVVPLPGFTRRRRFYRMPGIWRASRSRDLNQGAMHGDLRQGAARVTAPFTLSPCGETGRGMPKAAGGGAFGG